MIRVRQLDKAFGTRAVLRGLDLDVHPGELTLLVGANGAGKSTLLRILTGLLIPDGGNACVGGHDICRARLAALGTLSFLPQSPRFHPRLTTREVLRYYAALRDRTRREMEDEIAAWGLGDHATAATAELSGGLRQRLGLAVFFLARASVLVLDEPGLSLDPQWRRRLQEQLEQCARGGATVLVATHLIGEWEGGAGRCVLLDDGRMAGELDPRGLREHFHGAPAVPS